MIAEIKRKYCGKCPVHINKMRSAELANILRNGGARGGESRLQPQNKIVGRFTPQKAPKTNSNQYEKDIIGKRKIVAQRKSVGAKTALNARLRPTGGKKSTGNTEPSNRLNSTNVSDVGVGDNIFNAGTGTIHRVSGVGKKSLGVGTGKNLSLTRRLFKMPTGMASDRGADARAKKRRMGDDMSGRTPAPAPTPAVKPKTKSKDSYIERLTKRTIKKEAKEKKFKEMEAKVRTQFKENEAMGAEDINRGKTKQELLTEKNLKQSKFQDDKIAKIKKNIAEGKAGGAGGAGQAKGGTGQATNITKASVFLNDKNARNKLTLDKLKVWDMLDEEVRDGDNDDLPTSKAGKYYTELKNALNGKEPSGHERWHIANLGWELKNKPNRLKALRKKMRAEGYL